MVSYLSTTLLLACLAAVGADEPTPCCPPKQFTIRIDEETTDLVDGVVTTLEQQVHKAYDATNKLLTDILFQYDSVTGATVQSKTIYLFPQGAKYVIRNGKCTKETLHYQFLELCVPAVAKYGHSYTFGLGEYSANLFYLEIPHQGYNQVYDFVYGADKCIPYQYAVSRKAAGTTSSASSAGFNGTLTLPVPFNQSRLAVGAEVPLSIRAQYFDYVEGISDPAYWFKLPAECKQLEQQPSEKQKAAAKMMTKKLMAKLNSDKKFVMY
ncbi:uncharacterized protein LOC110980818 [Acanthaster planci]|uniref:Uncharacterized protein LOC110980818 n=1 Tax=Acanthaster planci TaxID=133434 RepID=A0A8B7YM45_ACAPL|nr:uncharacterized protein LOC110980818 [Acanthaster planci]